MQNASQKETKFKIIKNKIKKALKKVTFGIVLFHAGTQAINWINDSVNVLWPSKQRAEFEQEYGISIKGWKGDVEEQNYALSFAAEVVDKEQREKPFQLCSISFESENYLKKNFINQARYLFTTEHSGYYLLNRITLRFPNLSVLHHEIKHAKTFEIIEKHPEFIEKWKALAFDENGNSQYLNRLEQVCSKAKILNKLVMEKYSDSEQNIKFGFVTNYARTNLYEDVAEVCELAERPFGDELKKNQNPIIAAKIKLAEEYALIPREFSEYVALKELFEDAISSFGFHTNLEESQSFIEKSEQFLRNHPNSVYEISIRSNRGKIFEKESPELAIKEWKQGLTAQFKEHLDYAIILKYIAQAYSKLNAPEKSQLYDNAYQEFHRRLKNNDVHISKRGVNDFLQSHGELR